MSSDHRKETVSDALLDVQQHPNQKRKIQRFGILLVVITLLAAVVLPDRLILIIVSVALGIITAVYPNILSPFYGILTPVFNLGLKAILGLLFYVIVCPIAFLARIMGFDIIQRNFEPEAESYWIERSSQPARGNQWMKSQR
jgi:uncharacterized YccA/Bax inhibitor family protein